MSRNSTHHADFGRDFDAELGITIAEPESSDLDVATTAMRDAVAALGGSTDDFDGFLEAEQPRKRFAPGYEQAASTRVLRVRISPDEHGVDRIRFHGRVISAWVATSPRSGRGSVYAEVDSSAHHDTLMGVAVIPTGKPAPLNASRMGSAGSAHFYLLGTATPACGTHGRLALAAPDTMPDTMPDTTSTSADGSPAAAEDGEG